MKKCGQNIGQVSQLTGFSQRMLRYFEEHGLLSVARRDGGSRTYSDADITQILRIRQLHDLGFSYSQVKELLNEGEVELAAKGTELLEAHHRTATDLLEKIQRLEFICFGGKQTHELTGSERVKRTLQAPQRTAYTLRGADLMESAFISATGLTAARFIYWKFGELFSELVAAPKKLELFEIFDQSAYFAILTGSDIAPAYSAAWKTGVGIDLGLSRVGEFDLNDLPEFFANNDIVVEQTYQDTSGAIAFHSLAPYQALFAKLGRRAAPQG